MPCEVIEQTLVSLVSIGCLGSTRPCNLPVELCAGQDTGGLLKRGIEGDQMMRVPEAVSWGDQLKELGIKQDSGKTRPQEFWGLEDYL